MFKNNFLLRNRQQQEIDHNYHPTKPKFRKTNNRCVSGLGLSTQHLEYSFVQPSFHLCRPVGDSTTTLSVSYKQVCAVTLVPNAQEKLMKKKKGISDMIITKA